MWWEIRKIGRTVEPEIWIRTDRVKSVRDRCLRWVFEGLLERGVSAGCGKTGDIDTVEINRSGVLRWRARGKTNETSGHVK